MNDFKLGDRVEYVGLRRGYSTDDLMGQHGKITELDGESVRVLWDSGRPYGVYGENLRHITHAPDVITINRADLPEVSMDGNVTLRSGSTTCHREFESARMRASSLERLAMAEFLEAREKAAEEAAALLSKRRNDLAKEVAKKAGWNDWEHASYYSHQSEAQAAIDMMIAAEDDRG